MWFVILFLSMFVLVYMKPRIFLKIQMAMYMFLLLEFMLL